MKLFNLEPAQHEKLLGYSMIAYGTSTLVTSIGGIWTVLSFIGSTRFPSSQSDIFAAQLLAPIIKTAVSVLCGLFLLNRDLRNSYSISSKIACLIFAFFSFSYFPLGSIVSAYALYYAVKLYPENKDLYPIPAESNKAPDVDSGADK